MLTTGTDDMAKAHLVSRPQIMRRPEQIPLNQALEKVEPETERAVIEPGDGTVKGVLEGGLYEAETGGRGADTVHPAGKEV